MRRTAWSDRNPEDADVILVNTCSVRERAQEKVFHDLGRVNNLKEQRADVILGVGGCVASQEGAAIIARAPYVDLVFGPQTLHRCRPDRRRRASGNRRSIFRSRKSKNSTTCRRHGSKAAAHTCRSWKGCSKYCTFCVVPYTRGEEVSRPARRHSDRNRRTRRTGRREITAARAERGMPTGYVQETGAASAK